VEGGGGRAKGGHPQPTSTAAPGAKVSLLLAHVACGRRYPLPTNVQTPPKRSAGFGAGLDEFEDDVAAAASGRNANGQIAAGPAGLAGLFGRQRLSQRFGADLAGQQQRAVRGGDDDAPQREGLAERRAKFDAVAARRLADAEARDEEERERGDGFDYEVRRGRWGWVGGWVG
jgi:hypothetical protein